MLNPNRLEEIVSFIDKVRRPGDEEFETLRKMAGEILDAYTERTEQDTMHLQRLINEHGVLPVDDTVETGRGTIHAERVELGILHSRKRQR